MRKMSIKTHQSQVKSRLTEQLKRLGLVKKSQQEGLDLEKQKYEAKYIEDMRSAK